MSGLPRRWHCANCGRFRPKRLCGVRVSIEETWASCDETCPCGEYEVYGTGWEMSS